MTTTSDRAQTVTVPSPAPVRQLTGRGVLAVWAAAALPMAALAWVVVPWLAGSWAGPAPFARALLVCLTAGLVWQFVLVLGMLWREQGRLGWGTLRAALWLRCPQSPRTGRVGGRVWWVVLPLAAAFAVKQLVPSLPHPAWLDFSGLLRSPAGQHLLHGNWPLFALILMMFLFNTVLGEELLFRGFLLPRMNGAFGRWDWLVNGLLFAAYHIHVWWAIPVALLDTLIIAHPTKRYGSAWIGITVHSAQSVFFTVLLLGVVL